MSTLKAVPKCYYDQQRSVLQAIRYLMLVYNECHKRGFHQSHPSALSN